MKTPIWDFVKEYEKKNTVRFHMPGHKGTGPIGAEVFDITEIAGADDLYHAHGIIEESERNASVLFGTGATLFSTEGSSQCIKTMVALAAMQYKRKQNLLGRQSGSSKDGNGEKPVILAARNVHKAFIYAAALVDVEIEWLWPEATDSICRCPVMPETLQKRLEELGERVAAVYLTSPDYLGGTADVREVARICHEAQVLCLVDNAHGAYLHFLEPKCHPMDLGADICCDSAHKTFPALTGAAYLHFAKTVPEELVREAKQTMQLFGSTSPSYLILSSLDLCNAYMEDRLTQKIAAFSKQIEEVRQELKNKGFEIERTDPLRITIRAGAGTTGETMAEQLRMHGIECEYADEDYVVLMLSTQNSAKDLKRLTDAMEQIKETKVSVRRNTGNPMLQVNHRPQKVMSVREAYFSTGERLLVEASLGRICKEPTVTCPPAIPVVVPGERVDETAVALFQYYGMETIEVCK